MKAADVYQRTTDAIVEQLESGTDLGEWSAPWHHQCSGMPTNAATGKAYRGGNILALWVAEIENAYGSSFWATYKQWSALGRQVVRGQRASFGIKWVDRGIKDDGPQSGEISLRDLDRKAFPVGFAVFNYAQTEPAEGFDGAVWEVPTARTGPDSIPECAAFFERIGATIVSGAPSYSPGTDTIRLPDLSAFDNAVSFYATSAHEHAHWSGHSSRLARDLSGKFGSEPYAGEELVAELAAAFLAAVLGIETQPTRGSWPVHRLVDQGPALRIPVRFTEHRRQRKAAADYLIEKGQAAERSSGASAAMEVAA